MDVVVIGCGAAKLNEPAKAKDLYTGQLFKLNLEYAEKFYPNTARFIFSAKYGFVETDEVLEPYNTRIGKPGSLTKPEIKMSAIHKGIIGARVILLAGRDYQKALRDCFAEFEVPFEGLQIGYRLQALNKALKEVQG